MNRRSSLVSKFVLSTAAFARREYRRSSSIFSLAGVPCALKIALSPPSFLLFLLLLILSFFLLPLPVPPSVSLLHCLLLSNPLSLSAPSSPPNWPLQSGCGKSRSSYYNWDRWLILSPSLPKPDPIPFHPHP